MFSGETNEDWFLAAWDPRSYLHICTKKKKKTGKKETKKLEVVSSALMGLLGIDTLM